MFHLVQNEESFSLSSVAFWELKRVKDQSCEESAAKKIKVELASSKV